MNLGVCDNNYKREPIAIIGIGCRFPGGADNPGKFWSMLMEGKDAISEIPEDRWSIANFYDRNRSKVGKANTRWGGFINKRIDEFDAQFFGISPREASMLDPQQRLLLEVCYEAFEDGGQIVEQMMGTKTGVFMGGFTLDWKILQFKDNNRNFIDSHSATGSMMTLLANRISYAFDLKGPSVAIDTACSSSLVAVHLACQSIWNNECQAAIAGGVNVMLQPEYFIAESKAGMLSPDGRSKTYDSSANGYARGEGAGAVILKPLSKAIADNDDIYAVIRGTGCNQDGHTSGITVPSSDAQIALMREVYERAGISPSEIQYIEAHGTGTPVGDPIEATAIGTVLSDGRPKDEYCYVGSVKTNIGHLEAAAGIAGLIKTVLCIKNGMIPKHLHLNNPNPKIDFEGLRLRVPVEGVKWPRTEGPKRAGVNSFGFGGTNAHVLLEELVSCDSESVNNSTELLDNKPVLIPLSARSTKSLHLFANEIKNIIGREGSTLSDLGFSLSLKRDHYNHRAAIVASTNDELSELLDAFIRDEARLGVCTPSLEQKQPLIAFVFTGMGPQWWAMGHKLLREEIVFRDAIANVDEKFKELSGWSILNEMLVSEDISRMSETEVAQPANFAIQVGLAALWESWGVKPNAIIGHSAGEAAAAFVAGAMSLEDAVKVIYTRSRLQQLTTGQGKMAAVGLSYNEAAEMIESYGSRVSIAAINSPTAITLSGDPEVLKEIAVYLEGKSIFFKYLHVKVPYHSHYMETIKDELFESLKDIKLKPTSIPLYSTVTGKIIDGSDLNAGYWWRNVREPVFFSNGCKEMISAGYNVFIEVGPHPVLASSIKECMSDIGKQGTVICSLRREEDEHIRMLSAAGTLYAQGYNIGWNRLYQGNPHFIKFPTYPWDFGSYWQESNNSKIVRLGGDAHPLLGNRLNSPTMSWENDLNTSNLPFLEDHMIQNAVTFPGAGYIEMGLAAVKDLYGKAKVIFGENIKFNKAMFIPDDKVMKMRLTYDEKTTEFCIYSQPVDAESNTEWTLNATGKVYPSNKEICIENSINSYKERCTQAISKEECYNQFKNLGLVYGEMFQGIQELWQGCDEAFASVKICDALDNDIENYSIHPALLDICFQVLAASLPFIKEKENAKVYMPTFVESAFLAGQLKKQMYIYAKINEKSDALLKGDIVLMDEDGNVILQINGCQAVSLNENSKTYTRNQEYYEYKWFLQERGEAKEKAAAKDGEHGTWVILADQKGIAASFAAMLKEHGGHPFIVNIGDDYKYSQSNAVVNPKNPEHFKQLFGDIARITNNSCEGIVHFWGLDMKDTKDLNNDLLEQAEEVGVHSALFIVQGIVPLSWQKAPKLWFITKGSQMVLSGQEEICIAQSSIWGMGRVIGHQEHLDYYGGMIDINPCSPEEDINRLFMEIWNTDGEDQVAFRNGNRYVARMVVSTELDKPVPVTFHKDACYLITGGLGSLGLLVAHWMIERGATRFILVGQTEIPPRSQWNSAELENSIVKKISAIKGLEALGASVHIASIDVANESELKRYLDSYRSEGWPAIKGVIHSAGVAIPQLMMQMNTASFNKVLRPKIMGAWNLHQYFLEEDLDFFVLFSSIASLVVLGGQANYSAGNAFMDALANYRKAINKPGISINWGPWAEVGMATQLDLLQYFIKKGLYPMMPEQGINALSHIIGQSVSQVAVLGADWPTVADKSYPMGIYPPMISGLLSMQYEKEASEKKVNSLDDKSFIEMLINITDEKERFNLLIEHLLDIVAFVLRLNRGKIEKNEPLTGWGLDSMMAIELKNCIEKSLHAGIAVVELLKGPTVEELSSLLMPKILENTVCTQNEDTADLLEEIDKMSPDEVEKLLEVINRGEK